MVEVLYVSFGDYCRIAAEVLGTTPEQVARLPRIALADSALASPRAGFGDQDAYPTLIEKAANPRRAPGQESPSPGRQQAVRLFGTGAFLGGQRKTDPGGRSRRGRSDGGENRRWGGNSKQDHRLAGEPDHLGRLTTH